MSGEHEAVRAALGRVGAWTFAFDARSAEQIGIDARALESLGYEAVWVPEGSSSRDIFAHLSLLATRSERITVCSGIANITARAPEVMAAGARTLADAFGERVVLGIGVGHEYSTEARGYAWERPLTRMRAYLERMDEAPWYAPKPRVGVRRMLAALGDGMLRLSAEQALGAHTYFVPAAHTAHARDVLGAEPVLAVELTAVSRPIPTEREGLRAAGRAGTWSCRTTLGTSSARGSSRAISSTAGATDSSTPRSPGGMSRRSPHACASTSPREPTTSACSS